MTMFPTHHLSSSKYDHDGGFSQGGYNCFISLGRGFSSDLMAEDESRTETSINNEELEEAVGSSSKDININVNINNIIHEEMNTNDDHGQWLQLSLGGCHSGGSSSRQPAQQPRLMFQVPEFRAGPTSNTFFLQPHHGAVTMNSVPMMTQQQQQQQQQETNYNYLQLIRPFPAPVFNPSVSSSSSISGSSEQHGRPLHVHRRLNVARVVNPPRRPHLGVWFMLQASQNQAKEPFLPQIPKSYLRIKDGRMTIGLLIKYLVNKLNLGSESEVEITCKGHQLLSLSTLQHVRDTIWNSPRNDVGLTLFPQSSAPSNHLMVLNYGRIA